ncbi:conserved hypothetical protein [Talaromyces stipitatus ATCC 10500]|uniref:GPI-anchored cell wall organization protein Ecm33 n=1 Tax=Talaromyces stipitatus (strain ATCC 10500 / CBS 375.48 / QM 6759 / NRRL 1006) TaxID=441959 RepID=B8MFX6_TALSN|nr:uncharacterized protein TSTA_009640 [Talaromyces stipitatus ATCC 10500]EED15843.1 conserved hypothetical protein [Talaromyces stipitatus ATCC 10500]
MMFLWTWMSRFAVAVGLLVSALAQLCTPEYGYEGYAYIVNDQSDLDAIAANCTTVNGTIIMSANYTGGFNLSNIRNITENIQWFQANRSDVRPQTTSIYLPDLKYLGGTLDMPGIPTLTSLIAPKLATVGWSLSIDYVQEVDLRSLVDLEYLSITGNVSSLRLDSLRQVRESILICNKVSCNSKISPNGSLDLYLPALQSAGNMDLEGRFSSFDTPNLTNITGLGALYYSIKLLTSGGSAINISFPELKYIPGGAVDFEGNIGSLSIPDISNMSALFTVDAYDRLDINLPFQEAAYITLTGNITSVRLPNLTSIEQFTVNSDADIDCKSLEQTITTATNKSEPLVICSTSWTSSGSHFSLHLHLGAKVAFGVFIGIFVEFAMS